MGKKPNEDNIESEIHEQFERLTQPDEYWALFDLLEKYKWSPAIEKKIEQMIEEGFLKGDQIETHSREVLTLDYVLNRVYAADKWTRQYQILKEIHHGHKTGLPPKAFNTILEIRRNMKKEERHISENEFKSLQKIRDDLLKNVKPKTELQWIYSNLDKVISRFINDRVYSDLGSTALFLPSDRADLKHEALVRLLRRGDYNHTLPRAAKMDYLATIVDSLIKDGRRAKLPGGVEISSEQSRNIFSVEAESYQSEANTMKIKRKKSA